MASKVHKWKCMLFVIWLFYFYKKLPIGSKCFKPFIPCVDLNLVMQSEELFNRLHVVSSTIFWSKPKFTNNEKNIYEKKNLNNDYSIVENINSKMSNSKPLNLFHALVMWCRPKSAINHSLFRVISFWPCKPAKLRDVQLLNFEYHFFE